MEALIAQWLCSVFGHGDARNPSLSLVVYGSYVRGQVGGDQGFNKGKMDIINHMLRSAELW